MQMFANRRPSLQFRPAKNCMVILSLNDIHSVVMHGMCILTVRQIKFYDIN